jgi:hypothetical protein
VKVFVFTGLILRSAVNNINQYSDSNISKRIAMRKRIAVLAATLFVALGGLLTFTTSAEATTGFASITGTVNCNGSTTYYSTTRLLAQTGNSIGLTLYDETGYYWTSLGIAQSVSGTYVGAQTFTSSGALNSTYQQKVFTPTVASNTIIPSGLYLANTRFRLNAAMATSNRGTCDNSFGGTLVY